jgi:hypothetical protein
VPQDGDFVIIQPGPYSDYNVTYDSSLSLAELRVTGGVTLSQPSPTTLTTNYLNVDSYGTYTLTGGQLMVNNDLNVDSNGTYNLVNGQLTVNAATNLGLSNSGPGTFTQQGGIYTVGGPSGGASLNVGSMVYTTGLGIYNLQDGILDVHGTVYVGRGVGVTGYSPEGHFYQGVPGNPGSGGVVTTHYTPAIPCGPSCMGLEGDGSLHIGYGGGYGTYNLFYGRLNVGGNIYVGYGIFQQGFQDVDGSLQGGGTLTIGDPKADPHGYANGMLEVGDYGKTMATYILYNGQLNTQLTAVFGTMHQYGGTHTIDPGTFYPPGFPIFQVMNTYNLTSGNLIVNGDARVGYGPLLGTFNQGYDGLKGQQAGDGGSVQVRGDLYLGDTDTGLPSGTGAYNLYNGQLTVSGNLNIGGTYTSGQFIHTGGNVTIGGNLVLGSSGGGSGTYALSGDPTTSTLTVTGTTYVGGSPGYTVPGGSGTFTQSGGTHSTGTLFVGGLGPGGGSGMYTLSGDPTTSTLTVTGTTYVGVMSSTGTFSQTGGTHTTGGLVVGQNGTYTLNGGILQVMAGGYGQIQNYGTFAYTGGTLQADQFQNNAGGTFTVSGPAVNTVNADVLAAAGSATYVSTTSAVFAGTFTLNGAFYSDPSTVTFMKDVTIGPNGFIRASRGDTYQIAAGFFNNSTTPGSWSVGGATLEFLSGTHEFLPGSDKNFAWGTLYIDAGATVTLEGSGYILGLIFGPGASFANIQSDGYTLSLPGAVPIPSALLLLGPGLVGLAAVRRRFER